MAAATSGKRWKVSLLPKKTNISEDRRPHRMVLPAVSEAPVRWLGFQPEFAQALAFRKGRFVLCFALVWHPKIPASFDAF